MLKVLMHWYLIGNELGSCSRKINSSKKLRIRFLASLPYKKPHGAVIFSQLVKKFRVFYETLSFITAFTTASQV